MAIGMLYYAFIVSSISSIVASFDSHNAVMRAQLIKLNNFSRDAKLPKEISALLKVHLEQASSDKANLYEADEILSDFPAMLREEVLMFMYRDMIAQMNFFWDKTPQFIVRFVTKLLPFFVKRGDYIVEEGSHSDEM